MSYNYAVVGATGSVGREIIQILAERGIPVGAVTAVASERSVGTEVSYGDDDVLKVQRLTLARRWGCLTDQISFSIWRPILNTCSRGMPAG